MGPTLDLKVFGLGLQETETNQNQAKQPRYQPMGAINIGWAQDHFPYHLTLLEIDFGSGATVVLE